MTRFRKILPALIVMLAVFLTYLPSLDNGFVNWDDDVHLLENVFTYPLDTTQAKKIFTSTVNQTYIPLTTLSFAVERYFFGADPFIYHFDNLLLHIAVSALLYYFALGMGAAVPAAFIAALIFGLHPMHVESVAWVTERKDVLCAFFYMAALTVYVRYARGARDNRPCHGQFALVIVLGILSMLSKAMALSLPLIFFLCDLFLKRKLTARVWVEKLYCVLAVAPLAWITFALQSRSIDMAPLKSVLMWVWCYVFYIKKFFWPDYYTHFYEWPRPVEISNPEHAIALVLFLVLAVSLAIFRKNKFYLLAVSFYTLSIFFLLRMDLGRDAHFVGDRFMYLPSVGWCIWAGWLLGDLWQDWKNRGMLKAAAVFAGVLLLAAMTCRTVQQIGYWSNSVTLWEHQRRWQPKAMRALVNVKLADGYLNEVPAQELDYGYIKNILDEALAINPNYREAFYTMGEFYMKTGDRSQAVIYFNKVLEMQPRHWMTLIQLGKMAFMSGRPEDGVRWFEEAVALNPDNPLVREYIRTFVASQH